MNALATAYAHHRDSSHSGTSGSTRGSGLGEEIESVPLVDVLIAGVDLALNESGPWPLGVIEGQVGVWGANTRASQLDSRSVPLLLIGRSISLSIGLSYFRLLLMLRCRWWFSDRMSTRARFPTSTMA